MTTPELYDLCIAGSAPGQKIALIKAVREVTGLGLKDAKELVESPLPATVLANISRAEAETIMAALELAGAQVSLIPPRYPELPYRALPNTGQRLVTRNPAASRGCLVLLALPVALGLGAAAAWWVG